MQVLEKASSLANRMLAVGAGLTLIAMMLVTVADMVLRVLDRPLAGTYEIIGWLAAVSTAFALGYTQLHRGHVSINLAVVRLGPKTRTALECLVQFVSLLLFGFAAWRITLYAAVLQESGSLSETLKIIVYPWVYAVALGAAGLALALLVDFLRSVRRLASGDAAKP
jgi:TRAP-type C4-dicarboxylate transport system permease small subunit